MVLQVRSRLFTQRDFAHLTTVIAHGFSHAGLTTQAKVNDIAEDPGKDRASKPERANVFVETLLERGWPEGDGSLLDILSNAEDQWGTESWTKARDRIWKTLCGKTHLVANEDGTWHLLPESDRTVADVTTESGTSNEADSSWPFTTAARKESGTAVASEPTPHSPPTYDGPPKVFLVQGRDQDAANQVRHFLRGVGLKPLAWEEVKKECAISPTTFEVVRKGLDMAHIIVVVLSGDDEARLNPKFLKSNDGENERDPKPQPRQNVLLEAGMALGMARDRTVMVRTTELREISDLSGINWVTMKGTSSARHDFANELTKALRASGVPEPLKHAPEMYDDEALGAFKSAAAAFRYT